MKRSQFPIAWIYGLVVGLIPILVMAQDPAIAGHDHSAHSQPAPAEVMVGHSAHLPVSDDPTNGVLRDPHAYSGGFTLETAPFRLAGGHSSHMAGTKNFLLVKMDRLEWSGSDDNVLDGMLSFGNSFDKLILEVEREDSATETAMGSSELLWSHGVAPFWDAQFGLRTDFGLQNDRHWIAVGIQGLMPYWFHVDAGAYLADDGHTEVLLEAEYEALFTQRLILEPRLDIGWRGRSDPQNGLARGWTSVTGGLRLRYEFSRQFAPYLGVELVEYLSGTRENLPDQQRSDTRWVAGLRFWF